MQMRTDNILLLMMDTVKEMTGGARLYWWAKLMERVEAERISGLGMTLAEAGKQRCNRYPGDDCLVMMEKRRRRRRRRRWRM